MTTICGNLSAYNTITVLAEGNITGTVTDHKTGQAYVFAGGNITSTISTLGNIFADAVGDVVGSITSTMHAQLVAV